MSSANKTFRLQVSVSLEMLDKIDFYSKKMGVSRSALCAMFIGQGIMGYEISSSSVQSVFDKLALNAEVELDKLAVDDNGGVVLSGRLQD